MTNPSPRPALRKAADAEIHPAAPRPARSPRARTVAPVPVPDARPTPDAESVNVGPVVPAPAPLKPPKKRHAEASRSAKPAKRKFSGATSDHLRVPEVPEVTSSQRAALDHLFEGDAAAARPTGSSKDKAKDKGKGAVQGGSEAAQAKKPKVKKPKADKPVDLMSGKTVDLGATVPKALRAAARDEAKRRGLDIDAVVTDLLHAWLTDRS